MKLDKLIEELCTNGIEYVKLSNVTNVLRGKRLTKNQLIDDGKYPVYHGGLEPLGYYNSNNRVANTVMIINVGASAGIIGYSINDFWSSDGCFCIEKCNLLNDRFLYHYLKNNESYFQSRVRRAGIPTLDNYVIESFKVPIPPLEVQEEIVRILDNFTELTAELTARQKQYAYYRDYLLSFGEDDNLSDKIASIDTSKVQYIKLGDIATVTKLAGFEFTAYVNYSNEGNIIALRGLNIKNGHLDLSDVKYIDNSDLSKLNRSKLVIGDMLFTYVGTVGQVALIDKDDKYYLAPNVALVRLNDKHSVNPKYLMYYFQTDIFFVNQINKLIQSSSMKNIPMEKIRKFIIPIPSIETQNKIVSILDRFDELCNGISEGLPAEIEARKKQYEYYRDALLSFDEKLCSQIVKVERAVPQ